MPKIGQIYKPNIGDGYSVEIVDEIDLLTDTVKVRYAEHPYVLPFYCSVESLLNNYRLITLPKGQQSTECAHEKWLVYHGFYDAFEYCEKCDAKRPLS